MILNTLHILDTLDKTKSIPRVAHFIKKYSKSKSKFITPSEISKVNIGDYDYIHTHTAMSAFSLRKYPNIIHHYYGLPLPIFKNKYTIKHYLNEKLMINKYNRIVTCSQYLADEIKQKYGREAEVLPLAVDLDNFKPNKIPQKQTYINHNKLDKKPHFLFVGKLTERKNAKTLIESIDIAKHSLPDIRLDIIGTGVQKDYLEQYTKDQNLINNIFFHGKVTNERLLELYNSTSFYVTASLWEGFGMPLVEAMACGNPVLASNIPAHREIINSAKTGYLVENKPEEWAKKMKESLHTNWERLAYDYAKTQNWSNYVNKLYRKNLT